MKRTFSHIIMGTLASLLVITLANTLMGCSATQVKHAAEQIRYAAGGPAPADVAPATQPSAAQAVLDTVHESVKAASETNPAVGAVAGLVALVAGAVAGIAGNATGKKTGIRQAHTVIAEIVDDISMFKQPDVSWTDSTRKLLEDLGYTDAVVAPSNADSSKPS